MLKHLEHISAVIVAAGLALVSYWLFFSWAGGGDLQKREQHNISDTEPIPWHPDPGVL